MILPTRGRFGAPFPGNFFGHSTHPEGCTSVKNELICANINNTVLIDGTFGDETRTLLPRGFHAWNSDSRLAFEYISAAVIVRQFNLFFYHNPSMRIGLPQFTLTTSDSAVLGGSPLQYTLLGNQDLSSGDATVKNATIVLTTPESNAFFHIQFAMTSEIHQFAVSEVQLCNDTGIIVLFDVPFLMLLLLVTCTCNL